MLIPAKVFKVSACAAKKSTRYAINGVYIERDSDGMCHAVVTDGRRMLDVMWNDHDHRFEFPAIKGLSHGKGGVFDTLVPISLWSDVSKAIPKRGKDVTLNAYLDESKKKEGDDSMAFGVTDGSRSQVFNAEKQEGTFPKWRDVIPNMDDTNSIEFGINPVLLAEVLKTIALIATNEEAKGARLRIPLNMNRPMTVGARCTSDGVEAIGVVMPVNLYESGYEQPKGTPKPVVHSAELYATLQQTEEVLERVLEQEDEDDPPGRMLPANDAQRLGSLLDDVQQLLARVEGFAGAGEMDQFYRELEEKLREERRARNEGKDKADAETKEPTPSQETANADAEKASEGSDPESGESGKPLRVRERVGGDGPSDGVPAAEPDGAVQAGGDKGSEIA